MKLTITREALLTPLQLITGVVEKRQTMPVLANVLLVLENGSLVMTGTNMEVELVANVHDVEGEQDGRITVPAKKLTDICKALKDASFVKIELKEGKLHLKSGSSHFTLATLPAEHFPNVEEGDENIRVKLSQRDFSKIISATAFAMAQQDVRYYLNGMLFELTCDVMRLVATDGHRLALGQTSLEVEINETKQYIVPRKGVLELNRLLEDTDEKLELVFGSNHIRASIGNYMFTSKLIDGKFPDYQRVIPKGGDKTILADRMSLRSMLTRASILSHESIRGIRVEVSENMLRVFANNPDQEEAEDSLEVEYQGESLQIGFNVSYLIDVMTVLSDEQVKLTLSGPNSSALLESAESKGAMYVVMPMRL